MKKIILMMLLFVLALPVFAEYMDDDPFTTRQMEFENTIHNTYVPYIKDVYGIDIVFDCEIYYSEETCVITVINFYSDNLNEFIEQALCVFDVLYQICIDNNQTFEGLGILCVDFIWLDGNYEITEGEDRYNFSAYNSMWELYFMADECNGLITVSAMERTQILIYSFEVLYNYHLELQKALYNSSVSLDAEIGEN